MTTYKRKTRVRPLLVERAGETICEHFNKPFDCPECRTKRDREESFTIVTELGRKAAKARYQRDEATCRFHTDYMRRFIDARPTIKTELRAAFDQAYKDESQEHFNSIKSTIRW